MSIEHQMALMDRIDSMRQDYDEMIRRVITGEDIFLFGHRARLSIEWVDEKPAGFDEIIKQMAAKP